MATFVLIHGGGDVGWYWHLVEAELRRARTRRGRPRPAVRRRFRWAAEYADAVVDAVGDRRHLVVVGQSYGGFTAPLVADRLPVDVLVLRGRDDPGSRGDARRLVGQHRLRTGRAGAGRGETAA